MSPHAKPFDLEKFQFRGLHPRVFIGTTTDRYAGWSGQIYSKERYQARISRRTHTVGGKSFVEEVLPIDSVEEYFEHFPVLEIDFTFYRLLLEKDGRPTQNYHVLREYRKYLGERDLQCAREARGWPSTFSLDMASIPSKTILKGRVE